jgi:hypothetical protein
MAMAREPRTSPIVPSYGESSLAELSTSILASLTGDAAANVLNLPEADRVCLLIIDGLGLELLRAHQAAAPFLAELAFNSRPLTAGFPSTTVTSLASIGTGLVPAVHGMLGYQVAIGGTDRLLNGLHWPEDIDPAAWQPQPTIFERALAAGITPVHIAPGAYAKSGLTRAALRGAEYRAADSLGTLAALAAAALAESDRTFVAAYHGDLDAAGHRYGVSSPAWTFQLAHVDRLAEQLASSLPYGSVLYVTADHGMVNVGSDDRIDVDGAASALRDGVGLLGGECTPARAPPPTCWPPGGRCSASTPGWCPARRPSSTAGSARPASARSTGPTRRWPRGSAMWWPRAREHRPSSPRRPSPVNPRSSACTAR